MLQKIRTSMIKLENRNGDLVIRSLCGGKKVISKDSIRVLDDSILNCSSNKILDNYSYNKIEVKDSTICTKISIQGFYSSGSSVVLDLLKEFNNIDCVGAFNSESVCHEGPCIEVNFYRELKLYEFCNLLFLKNELLIDKEIKLIIEASKKNLKHLFDLGIIKIDPIKEFNKMLMQLVDLNNCNFQDVSNFLPLWYNENIVNNTIKDYENNYIYYSLKDNISKVNIINIIRKFIIKIIDSITTKKYLALDQFLSTNRGWDLDFHKQFVGNNLKQIVVYRDPRDQLMCNIIWSGHVPYYETAVGQYLDFKTALKNYSLYEAYHPDRLFISFEELINNYDSSVDKICTFLKIDKNNHVNKFKHFNPEVSRKNIGIYKKYHNQKLMQEIYEHFKKYCYS